MREAGEVWQTAHTIFIMAQNGSAQRTGEGGGTGTDKHHLNWVADVRKLVDTPSHLIALDKMYGHREEVLTFTREAELACMDILRAFAFRLFDSPAVMAYYPRMRKTVFE